MDVLGRKPTSIYEDAIVGVPVLSPFNLFNFSTFSVKLSFYAAFSGARHFKKWSTKSMFFNNLGGD